MLKWWRSLKEKKKWAYYLMIPIGLVFFVIQILGNMSSKSYKRAKDAVDETKVKDADLKARREEAEKRADDHKSDADAERDKRESAEDVGEDWNK